MAPREMENNAYAKCGVTDKEHYGMVCYGIFWSGQYRANTRLFSDLTLKTLTNCFVCCNSPFLLISVNKTANIRL